MRHRILWTLVLSALPGVALGDSATGPLAEPISPADEPAIERAEPAAAGAPSGLDLRIDPTGLPAHPPTAPGAIAPAATAHAGGADHPSTDRGLSFDFELTPRSSADNLARTSQADAPGLQDDVERLIERATLGLRGKYRF